MYVFIYLFICPLKPLHFLLLREKKVASSNASQTISPMLIQCSTIASKKDNRSC